MKKMFYAIMIVIVATIATPLSTFALADNIVTEAVNKLDVDSGPPHPIHIGTEDVLYADHFSFINKAEIPLVLENVNVNAYITSFPSHDSQYGIGSFSIENEKVNANGQIGFPINFTVTSEDALNQIYSLSYGVGEKIETTVSGSYLF